MWWVVGGGCILVVGLTMYVQYSMYGVQDCVLVLCLCRTVEVKLRSEMRMCMRICVRVCVCTVKYGGVLRRTVGIMVRDGACGRVLTLR